MCGDLDLPIVTAGGGGGEAVPGALEVTVAEAGVAAGGEAVPGCEAVCPDNGVIRHLATCNLLLNTRVLLTQQCLLSDALIHICSTADLQPGGAT